jgi:hypothetical protein
MRPTRMSLEDIFLQLTTQESQEPAAAAEPVAPAAPAEGEAPNA